MATCCGEDNNDSSAISARNRFEYECFTPCYIKAIKKDTSPLCLKCKAKLCNTSTLFHGNSFNLQPTRRHKYVQTNGSVERLQPAEHALTFTKLQGEIKDLCYGSKNREEYTSSVDVNYRSYNHMHNKAEISATENKLMTLVTVQAAIERAQQQKENLRKVYEKAKADLMSAKYTTFQTTQSYRSQINEMLDQLERTTKEELNNIFEQFYKELKYCMTQVTSLLQDLNKYANEIISSSNNETHANVRSDEPHISNIDNVIVKQSRNLVSSPTRISEHVENHNFSKGLKSVEKNIKKSFPTNNNKHGLETKTVEHSIRVGDDAYKCCVWGTCVLDSGAILLTDGCYYIGTNRVGNNKLKLFDMTANKVTSYCIMPDSPRAVCAVCSEEAAVSLINKTIQFVSIGAHVMLTRAVMMDHHCTGLAFQDNTMYISDSEKILYVYSIEGKMLKRIKEGHLGEEIFSETRHVTVSGVSSRIYVADIQKGLITLDLQNQVVWQYCRNDLARATGVSTDDYGNVFVCGIDSHNVLQLGHDGTRVGEIVTSLHGVQFPTSVCFDKYSSSLIVTNIADNNILIFPLTRI